MATIVSFSTVFVLGWGGSLSASWWILFVFNTFSYEIFSGSDCAGLREFVNGFVKCWRNEKKRKKPQVSENLHLPARYSGTIQSCMLFYIKKVLNDHFVREV